MRYVAVVLLLLVGCAANDSASKWRPVHRSVDVSKLVECPLKVINMKRRFVTFLGDNGDTLYADTQTSYMCLKRKVN